MPLVVPGVQSTGGDAGQEWMSKLAGKKLGEEHNETVCIPIYSSVYFFCSAPHMK